VKGQHNRSNSFVLRIWWEEGEASPVWRGWVQHAASGDARYFQRLADLLAFVEAHAGLLSKLGLPETHSANEAYRTVGGGVEV
jgi:hypothetical protein